MDLTDILELLANRHRRQLLRALDDQTPLRESDLPWVNGEMSQSLQTTMRHSHLPKLNENSVIDYDRRTGMIVRGPAYEETKAVLDSVQDEEPPTVS